VAYFRAFFLVLIMTTVAVAMPMLDGFGPNQLVSTRSKTYAAWAPDNLRFSGGLIFGRGHARFVIGNPKKFFDVSTDKVGVNIKQGEGLELSTTRDGKALTFALRVHTFTVCPMARHIRREAPIAYTIPPYLDAAYIKKVGLIPAGVNHFIAREFEGDERLSKLIKDADFWIEHPRRASVEMDPSLEQRVIDDTNRTVIKEPSEAALARGLTYFSGDFHTKAVILLNTEDQKAYIVGWPMAYAPELVDGKIKITQVALLAARDEDELSSNTSFGPADFKSLFDLSLLFAAMRDDAPGKFKSFVDKNC
jgi:hypothetical protein